MSLNTRGQVRGNALWGRRGERANALWGRSGRRVVLGVVAALTIVIPLGASAGSNRGGAAQDTFVAPGLLEHAEKNPGQKLHLIIQSTGGADDAAAKLKGVGGEVRKNLALIGAVAVDVPAGKLKVLAKNPGLTITADAPVKLSGAFNSSTQLWPYDTGSAVLWGWPSDPAPPTPTIAIVDSGIDANRADFDFGARVLPQVTLTTRTSNAPGDGRGHGTFVASIAAGSAPGHAGAAPNARILPIDVMDDNGVALTSDVIAACGYILQNKVALNIRVANFSLHSGARNHFYNDPLDRAVEKLWFNGVLVVAAAGNYGASSGPSGVLYAPGNDPFVVTVGALDLNNSFYASYHKAAPFSAWGYTEDGFAKPELGAPGRFIIGAVPTSATLTAERPDHVVAPGYMELSGTSFAAPIVSATAAQVFARHPSWTPDQVKGALMLTARSLPNAVPGSLGVGELNAVRAALYQSAPPNPNNALERFLTVSPDNVAFDATNWNDYVKNNTSWLAASWGDASWGDLSWSQASWGDAGWVLADASWGDASWGDLSSEDAAEGDNSEPAPAMSPSLASALEADPNLALPAAQAAHDPSLSAPRH